MIKKWAIDTNIILSKKNVSKRLLDGKRLFMNNIYEMDDAISAKDFIGASSYEFIIPYFVMEEIKNQIKNGTKQYINTLKNIDAKIKVNNWEKIVSNEIRKQITAFEKKFKILKKPDDSLISGWTIQFFESVGKNGISSSDAKDFLIGKEIEENGIEYLVTDNTKDFESAFPSITAINYSMAINDLNTLRLSSKGTSVIDNFIKKNGFDERCDLHEDAFSVLISSDIIRIDDENKKYKIKLLYKNTWKVKPIEGMLYEGLYPKETSVIIEVEVKEDRDINILKEEVNE